MRTNPLLVATALLAVLTACGGTGSSASPLVNASGRATDPTPSATTATSASPLVNASARATDPTPSATTATSALPAASAAATPPIEGRFAVAEDGRELSMTCWGDGDPTVIFEDGHPSEVGGILQFGRTAVAQALAQTTRVCAYDRAGWGSSDPAPNEPRDADDVIGDLKALLTAAAVEPPYVLVGASFGGMIVSYYAARHPDDVVGVVLLDVPAPSAEFSVDEIPEIAWDHPQNPEHVDIVPEFETRFAKERLPIEAPLVVITATDGDSSVEDQSLWLEISDDATQIEATGRHDIYLDDSATVTAAIQQLIDEAR